MNRIWLVTALGAALGVSCGDPTTSVPNPLNLDRPVDLAFACYGGMRVTGMPADQKIPQTAQPATSCDLRSQTIPSVPVGQEGVDDDPTLIPSWYGFILQSASGTVAIAKWATQPAEKFAGADVHVLDADPLTPGANSISIGEEPIAIATDKAGCYEVTANAGSCDLSELDIGSVLDGDPMTPAVVKRVDVMNQAQVPVPIRAKPAAMVAEPNTTVVGSACPATATGLVYIAYPSCHLVAGVDTATGIMVTAIQYDTATGIPRILNSPEVDTLTCPSECADPGMPGNDPIVPGVRPVALDLRLDPRPTVNTKRMVIGADNSASLTVVELGADSRPQSLSQIALSPPAPPDKLGITAIALSPQIRMGGILLGNDVTLGDGSDLGDRSDEGGPPEEQGQYVYAVATDHTVRVVDVLTSKECDTQVDTRFVRSITDVKRLSCFPVGDPATPPRRSGAKGPGIELIGDGVPTSVAFVKAPRVPKNPIDPQSTNDPVKDLTDSRTAGPSTLLGYFAIITASNGQAFVVNVDDDNSTADWFTSTAPQSTAPTLVMAHQLRDSVGDRGLAPSTTVTIPDPNDSTMTTSVTAASCKKFALDADQAGGGPHATTTPVNTTPVNNVVAGSSVGPPVSAAKFPELPNILQVECTSTGPAGDAPDGMPVSELQITADPLQVRDPVFPDLRNLFSDENWSLTWEGALSQDSSLTAVDGPPVRTAQMHVDSTASSHIFDPTRPFCEMGVEPFDILQMRGCNPLIGDADCPSGYQCYVHPDSSVTVGGAPVGACMLRTEASRLTAACRDFLISLRRYTVGYAGSGELQILPRKHELRTTPLDGCTGDAQCSALADYAAQNGKDGIDGTQAVNRDKWVCRADDARAPINADPTKNKRCVQTCALHSKEIDGKDRDLDCDAGTICQGASATAPGTCMEGIMPPQACVNGPQRFEVRASEAFTVIGTRSGYVHPIIETTPILAHGGMCSRDPAQTASSLQIGRIPLKALACGPVPGTDQITGALPSPMIGFEPNPCSLTTPQVEYQRTCTGATTTLVTPSRDAPAIKFRNRGMTLTVVDPYYPGDATCPLDRQGIPDPSIVKGSDRVPLVFPGYQLAFHQSAGYTPLTLGTVATSFNPVFPVKVVAGPTHSIWVLDDGDFLSTTVGLSSTRGQVFRIESSHLTVVNLLQ